LNGSARSTSNGWLHANGPLPGYGWWTDPAQRRLLALAA